ncbi:unnamed protein product [Ranitomeya imitator]|uniref:ribonuclease H n=1 Tax=Ranitomeya imitator TaxID=111125 RepID=A0ABN9LYI7_9NEOB|nr:unnamed protein product [Ranitomeya imitator]
MLGTGGQMLAGRQAGLLECLAQAGQMLAGRQAGLLECWADAGRQAGLLECLAQAGQMQAGWASGMLGTGWADAGRQAGLLECLAQAGQMQAGWASGMLGTGWADAGRQAGLECLAGCRQAGLLECLLGRCWQAGWASGMLGTGWADAGRQAGLGFWNAWHRLGRCWQAGWASGMLGTGWADAGRQAGLLECLAQAGQMLAGRQAGLLECLAQAGQMLAGRLGFWNAWHRLGRCWQAGWASGMLGTGCWAECWQACRQAGLLECLAQAGQMLADGQAGRLGFWNAWHRLGRCWQADWASGMLGTGWADAGWQAGLLECLAQAGQMLAGRLGFWNAWHRLGRCWLAGRLASGFFLLEMFQFGYSLYDQGVGGMGDVRAVVRMDESREQQITRLLNSVQTQNKDVKQEPCSEESWWATENERNSAAPNIKLPVDIVKDAWDDDDDDEKFSESCYGENRINAALDRRLKEELQDKRTDYRYLEMQRFREKLPSNNMKQEIIKMISGNQVTVISGETGCGKTTQVTQFILDDYINKGKGSACHIVCTQPRRISAISVAERVAAERAEPCGMGHSTGYQIRLECQLPRTQGSILYCTTGIVLQWLQSDQLISSGNRVQILTERAVWYTPHFPLSDPLAGLCPLSPLRVFQGDFLVASPRLFPSSTRSSERAERKTVVTGGDLPPSRKGLTPSSAPSGDGAGRRISSSRTLSTSRGLLTRSSSMERDASSGSSPDPTASSRIPRSTRSPSSEADIGSDVASQSESDSDADQTSGTQDMVDSFISAIIQTLELKEEDETSQDDFVPFKRVKRSSRVFPNHKEFENTTSRHWEHPGKRFPGRKRLDILYPFDSDLVSKWSESPKVDPPVSRLSLQTVLSILDAASLKDATDRQIEALTKSAFEAAGASLCPNFASSWVAKAVSAWAKILCRGIVASAPSEELADLADQIAHAGKYLLNASLDAAACSARANSNIIAIRRVLGCRLFGTKLDQIISDTTGVPKKDGSLRPILELKWLNRHLRVRHFKMKSLRSVIASMEPGEYLCSVNIQDAYLHIPVCVQHQRFLRFAIQEQHYQFTALPFGLASAPRVFMKVMAVVMSILRSKGILIIPYLGDLLVKGPSRWDCSQSLQITLDTLTHLGWIINKEKSTLTPTQRLKFLGMEFDTIQAQVFLPKEFFFSLAGHQSPEVPCPPASPARYESTGVNGRFHGSLMLTSTLALSSWPSCLSGTGAHSPYTTQFAYLSM